MMARYTKIPADAFRKLQLNAAILLSDFDPADGSFEAADQLGATTGGVKFSAVPAYTDLGANIDNCPKNTMELKRLDSWEAKAAGTFVTMDTAAARSLLGAADLSGSDTSCVVPRSSVKDTDFTDVWLVGDYSDQNGAQHGGYLAIHLRNALSSGGFRIESGDRAKGQFDFTYLAHYALSQPDSVPFELYIKAGTAEV